MFYNVLDYLEKNAKKYKEKIALTDGEFTYNYENLLNVSKNIGFNLLKLKGNLYDYDIKRKSTLNKRPILFFMDKSSKTLAGFFGAIYSGSSYCLLNPDFPEDRIKYITKTLNSIIIVTNSETRNKAFDIFGKSNDYKIVDLDLLVDISDEDMKIRDIEISKIKKSMIDTDPLYINFTSGSTGVPKGIAVSHRSVIDFIDKFTDLFDINESDIIGNQAPFDFDVSVKDIYSSIFVGATLVIIPRKLFSKPKDLIDFLCENKVTTLVWAVSALCLVSSLHGLDYRIPEGINKIIFSGEVMPIKHLREWRRHLPNANFINVYGPTEITCNCTYHILEKDRDYEDYIPIGRNFPNEDVFLLDKNNNIIVKKDSIGEICVRGTALALGYYNNKMQTSKSFIQNPNNDLYPELIYKTGDLAKYDHNGDLVFAGRKDFQIKYQGHRIELEEIEKSVSKIDGIDRCICTFDEKKSKLKGYYVGNIQKDELLAKMRESLPIYMIPRKIVRIEKMPLTKNGKVDRKLLDSMEEIK